MVGGLAVFLASFTASINGEVKHLVTADLVVDSGTFTRGGLPSDLLTKVKDVPGVSAVSGWQVGRATVGFDQIRLTGIDGDEMDEVIEPTWQGTAPTSIDDRSVLLAKSTADQLRVVVGDQIPMTFTSGGTEDFRVAGVYTSGSALLGQAVIDRAALLRQVPATTDLFGLVALNPDNAATRKAVTELSASYGITSVLRPDEFVDRRSNLLRGFQRVIQWMLLFTLIQAMVGVINTLLLSVGERRREFGLLRIAGASRRQVLRLVLMEGGALSVCGTVLGLVLGAAGARLGVQALGSLGSPQFVVPAGTIVLTGVAALTLGMIAALGAGALGIIRAPSGGGRRHGLGRQASEVGHRRHPATRRTGPVDGHRAGPSRGPVGPGRLVARHARSTGRPGPHRADRGRVEAARPVGARCAGARCSPSK